MNTVIEKKGGIKRETKRKKRRIKRETKRKTYYIKRNRKSKTENCVDVLDNQDDNLHR